MAVSVTYNLLLKTAGDLFDNFHIPEATTGLSEIYGVLQNLK